VVKEGGLSKEKWENRERVPLAFVMVLALESLALKPVLTTCPTNPKSRPNGKKPAAPGTISAGKIGDSSKLSPRRTKRIAPTEF
jgi:hypothetical protein